MILNGNTIKELIAKNILIENGNMNNIRSASYDVTSSNYILKFRTNKEPISLADPSVLNNLVQKLNIKNGYQLKPQECILIPLEDSFNIPNDICAHIRGRTSFNRLGLYITIQHLNPGYKGKLNLTLTNLSPNTYIISPNMCLAQIIFEKLDNSAPINLLYYNEPFPSYQNENGLEGSKIYMDFVGKVVRHFKGNYYYIENICLDSETKEWTIIYRTLYDREDSKIWARPAKMFFESIDKNRPDNATKQEHRFELVNSLGIDYTKQGEKNDTNSNK